MGTCTNDSPTTMRQWCFTDMPLTSRVWYSLMPLRKMMKKTKQMTPMMNMRYKLVVICESGKCTDEHSGQLGRQPLRPMMMPPSF